ncbi:MAG: hypothetical protein P8N23_05110 [Methylophilaceae bacterium]|nr:hypothetical protein [Methylophilaceae bacterium]
MNLFNLRLKRFIFNLLKGDLSNSELEKEVLHFELLKAIQPNIKTLISKSPLKNVNSITYDELHRGAGYTTNNWAFDLLLEKEMIASKSVFEFGAGNGKFLTYLMKYGRKVAGLDLINPKKLSYITTGSVDMFDEKNLVNVDLAYSADFLEHLDYKQLSSLLCKISSVKIPNIHIIACYHDDVSHLSVYEPHEWAYIFSKFFTHVEIRNVNWRRYPLKKKFVVIFAK